MALFDAYSLMDFSARSTPSPVKPTADACWLGTFERGGKFRADYFRTRHAALAAWSAWVERQTAEHRRVLAGFDFAFGYPAGFADGAKLTADPKPWRATWTTLACRIEDDDANRNNRFHVASQLNESASLDTRSNQHGPFWGGPPSMLDACRSLHPKRLFDWPYTTQDGTALPRLRLTDRRTPNAQEVWKLAGIGSVGSQSILGIAALGRLLGLGNDAAAPWAPQARVWPFQMGFSKHPAFLKRQPAVLILEAFPSLLPEEVASRLDENQGIRDAAQVDAWCRWAAKLDHHDQLAPLLARPRGLTRRDHAACVAEEGWIFGVA